MEEKYYKVLGGEGLSPSTKFDYTSYLPRGSKAGKWLPKIANAKIRMEGYYVSKYWNMWYSRGARVFEVEIRGGSKGDSAAVEDQICCAQIRLLKDVTEDVERLIKDENFNLGLHNTGARNIGRHNTGDANTGNRNTGKHNSGDFNTGDANAGIDNVGDGNRGSGNVGSRNAGHSNTGDGNEGSFNTGSFNTGNANSGSFNVGSRNSGKWNLGDYHTGFFNTKEPLAVMFDKPTNVKVSEVRLPKWLNRKDCKKAFEEATPADAALALKLPNFDYEIFEKITSISKADFDKKLKEK